MPTTVRCPSCQQVVVVDLSTSASAGACPQCGARVQVPRPDPLVGRIISSHRLMRRIGAGAMAVVYEAEHQTSGQRAAIKMLTSEAAQDAENGKRFGREAALCRQISHPNVVAVHDSGCDQGVHFMVMELVDGQTMEALIDKQGRLSWRQVAQWVLQVAQALDHVAKQGIIHRDIKPANILLTKSGIAKLVDLGFGKKLSDHDTDIPKSADGNLTVAGVSMGSPAYMPPEQVLDAKQATPTADVYSLGATFFHAVTGMTPFNGKTAYEIMEKVLRDPVPSPRNFNPDLPVAIAHLIEWTMAKDPQGRPQSAGEFVRELEIAMFAPDDDSHIRRILRQRQPSWVLPVVVGAAALVVMALMCFLLMGRKH